VKVCPKNKGNVIIKVEENAMKICYFGTVCREETFQNICIRSKVKPSAAPQVFESMLIKGFDNIQDLNVEVNTFLPIPSIPLGFSLIWGRNKEKLTSKIYSRWLPALNIQIIKQFCFLIGTSVILMSWLFRNNKERDKVIFLYSIYMPVALPAIIIAHLFRCRIVSLVTDLPSFMFAYSREKGIKSLLVPIFVWLSRLIESHFDGYVLLTEQMNNVVNKRGKPHIVMEGLVNQDDFLGIHTFDEYDETRVIMYAGTLNKKFGIVNLIKGFMALPDKDLSLWFFGGGDVSDEILEYIKADPRIHYLGVKLRSEVLEHEIKATLLVNPRPSDEEFTKYSFPSKNMEYMASGTPLLTTKLPGMPEEYYEHVYLFDDESVEGMARTMEWILNLPKEELHAKGAAAKEFVLREKNNIVQAKRIIDMIKTMKDR